MSVYTVPALNAVDFALTAHTVPSLASPETALQAYTVPALNAVNFALTTTTPPTYMNVGWELLPSSGATPKSLVWQPHDAAGLSLFASTARRQQAQPQPFYLSNAPPPVGSFPPVAFAPMAHMLIR